MIYPSSFEHKIGFSSIRELLKEQCLSPLGVSRVDTMVFSDSFDKIRNELRQTTEFVTILQEEDFPSQNFFDVRQTLKRIRIQNTYLDVQELFDLQRSLATIIAITSFLQKLDNGEMPEKTDADDSDSEKERLNYKYPALQRLTEDIMTYPMLVRNIDRILDKFGHVKDSASPTLMAIRRELASMSGSISRTINSIMRAAKSEGLVDKDIAPTLRDGRLVIPVAPALKRKIRGIVHDESDSGRTVFIEPAEVVEANNRIRELESEERKEIKRILMEFSDNIRPDIRDIMVSYEFLADIDFIRAKARFAVLTESSEPQIEDKPMVDFALAIHPLLQQKFKREAQGKAVVPLDIKLTKKNRILLISGPNAGGKSICLKTTGLLQYMLQCGMLIPVAKSSIAGIFRNIFIDIGDEQSLENDLSTYSSHLLNMKQMMRHADGSTLILIDEFGTGTEPQIGGAIAESVLRRFNKRHAFGVITTHYQNLKHYAQETQGIINGAMLYDRQEMRPLFQLQIGNPGSSFAIEIARKIGLPEDVIADASSKVGSDYINSDKYLQDIVRDKRYWEQKRQAIHQQEKQMQQTIEHYEQVIAQLQSQRKEIIAEAKKDAEELLMRSNARIEQTVREIKEAQADNERTRKIRQSHAEFKQNVAAIDESELDERIKHQMEKVMRRQQRHQQGEGKKRKNEVPSFLSSANSGNQSSTEGRNIAGKTSTADKDSSQETISTGSYVRLQGQSSVGKVIKINGNEALVAFGSIQTNVKVNRLQPAEKPKEQNKASTFISVQTRAEIREKTLNFSQDIDVRGMRGDEALQTITYYIDDAIVAGVRNVRILHGTGSGILKTLIRQYLATVPAVADYHDEHVQLGGAGITIVEF